jgi:hypothetical protein
MTIAKLRSAQAVLAVLVSIGLVGCALPVEPSTSPSPSENASQPSAPSLVPSPKTPKPAQPENLDAPPAGDAMAAVEDLKVKGRAPQTGYEREQFGAGWVDIDRNGCDTRNDMLKRDLTNKEMSGSCKVLAGSLQDPYTRTTIRFVYGGVSEVDVDHVVALSDAWQKGAFGWPYAKRVAFANDPLNLQPTDAGANRQKGDGDAATWLPANRSYRCEYVARQVAIKKKYGIWVTPAEQQAMLRILTECPEQDLPGPGSQPTIASNTGGQRPAAPGGQTPNQPAGKSSGASDPQFSTCTEAIGSGYGPYVQGKDKEYEWYIDRDGDGVVCE